MVHVAEIFPRLLGVELQGMIEKIDVMEVVVLEVKDNEGLGGIGRCD